MRNAFTAGSWRADVRFGGTRHQSAARFVAAHHAAMVFVASQDGNLTLLAWLSAEKRVIAIRNLQYLI